MSQLSTAAPSQDSEAIPPWVRWLSPLVVIVPVAGLAISVAAQWGGRSPRETWQDLVFANALGWLVGAFLCMTAPPHLFFPGPIARSIGWAPSPFQWELGVASAGMAVAGIMASGQPRSFSLATIIIFSVFLLGDAVGHIRSAVAEHNLSINNVGPIFFYDVLAPVFLIYLYAATS
jgi:hypothetical protein